MSIRPGWVFDHESWHLVDPDGRQHAKFDLLTADGRMFEVDGNFRTLRIWPNEIDQEPMDVVTVIAFLALRLGEDLVYLTAEDDSFIVNRALIVTEAREGGGDNGKVPALVSPGPGTPAR